jgi:hypothetical protein
MTQFIALELASRDPSRLAADLAGHRRYPENRPHAALGLRRAQRRNPRHRPTPEPANT